MNSENKGFNHGYKRGQQVGFAKGLLFGTMAVVGGFAVAVVVDKLVRG